jgi:hypothetical protein
MHGAKQNYVLRCLHSSYLTEILHTKYRYYFFGPRNKTAKSMRMKNSAAGHKQTGDLLGNGTVVTAALGILRVCDLLVGDSADVQLHVS